MSNWRKWLWLLLDDDDGAPPVFGPGLHVKLATTVRSLNAIHETRFLSRRTVLSLVPIHTTESV